MRDGFTKFIVYVNIALGFVKIYDLQEYIDISAVTWCSNNMYLIGLISFLLIILTYKGGGFLGMLTKGLK